MSVTVCTLIIDTSAKTSMGEHLEFSFTQFMGNNEGTAVGYAAIAVNPSKGSSEVFPSTSIVIYTDYNIREEIWDSIFQVQPEIKVVTINASNKITLTPVGYWPYGAGCSLLVKDTVFNINDKPVLLPGLLTFFTIKKTRRKCLQSL